MNTLLGRIAIGAVPGIVASGIAIFIGWKILHIGEEVPCKSQPCYVVMETKTNLLHERLAKLEASQHPSTSKRFTSDDALAMELRIVKCHNQDNWQKCLLQERLLYERGKK